MKLEISYKNSVIGSLSAGESLALHLNGQKLTEDLVVRAVAEEIPKLLAPTISISDGIISITNNNDVSVRYNVFVNGENYAGTTVDATTVDLTSFALEAGTYSVYLTAFADGYEESEPSNAVEYVVEESVPTDLTGYTVTVPANWSCSAGYGDFVINGSLSVGSTNKIFTHFYIGTAYTSTPQNMANNIWIMNSPDGSSSRYYFGSGNSFSVTFSGGRDVSKPELIQWFVDNNATFKKTA